MPSAPPPRFNNYQVAEIFDAIGDMLLILGDNRFKIIAYQNAAHTIEELNRDINSIHAAGELRSIPGIGQAIGDKIDELLTTGAIDYYTKLSAQVPIGVVEMMRVPDVGPKSARRLWEELNITGVEEMKVAAQTGRIRTLKGFGVKSEERILKGIELLARRQDDRTPLGDARPLADGLVADLLAALPPHTIQKIEVAGSLRRWRETIGDVDILAVSQEPVAVMEAFRGLPQAVEILGAGERKSSIALPSGMQVDLRVVESRHWGPALAYFTGSQAHNIAVREMAQKQGWSLNEYALTAQDHPQLPDGTERYFESEEELYAFLGLGWVAPELRENSGEMQAARQHSLPRLIEVGDILGELHSHTTQLQRWQEQYGREWPRRPGLGLPLLECERSGARHRDRRGGWGRDCWNSDAHLIEARLNHGYASRERFSLTPGCGGGEFWPMISLGAARCGAGQAGCGGGYPHGAAPGAGEDYPAVWLRCAADVWATPPGRPDWPSRPGSVRD